MLAVLLYLANVALAGEPKLSQRGQSVVEEDVVVTASRRRAVEQYIDRVSPAEQRRQMARWNVPLCIKYEGVNASVASFIQSRIVETAKRVSLDVGRKGCNENVLVKLSDQADELARAWVHLSPRRVGSASDESLPPKRLVDAIEAPRVVRWMTLTETINYDGLSFDHGEKPTNKLASASLIRSSTREVIRSKIVLIDAVRLSGVTLKQLGDHIAFVVLASPDIAADFSEQNSVMSLFSGGSRPTGMTSQDFRFLKALYSIPPDRPPAVQTGLLLDYMVRD